MCIIVNGGENMDKTLKNIIKRLEEHEKNHMRVDIGKKKRQLIRDSYQRLKAIEDDAKIGVQYDKKSAHIRIISQHIIACSEAPAFLILISLSDVCSINKCRNGFIINLEFNLWKWIKRDSIINNI